MPPEPRLTLYVPMASAKLVPVTVPALKLPDASRATMVEAVFELVALEATVNVWAEEPLNVAEPDKPVPDVARVRLLDTDPADVAEPLNVAVMVPALKLPDASRATMVEAVFRFVALEATVNVALPAWLAVKVCEPDKPVPETPKDSVPLLTLDAVVAVAALPLMLMPHVPVAFAPPVLGAPTVL